MNTILSKLQEYIASDNEQWPAAKERAYTYNGWFAPEFINLSVDTLSDFLRSSNLQPWTTEHPKTIGLVMPGKIPLHGFFDVISILLSGHKQIIRLSPKDDVLPRHLVNVMTTWQPSLSGLISFADMLKGCQAYIVSGNNNPSLLRYLKNYPGLVHEHLPTVAYITGDESKDELELLADDVFQYFGHGNLNVGKLYVPKGYDFIPMLKVFEKYGYLVDHNKYKNNYDYQLSLLILNKEFYMHNGSILLTESGLPLSPVARLHYEYYEGEPRFSLAERIVGRGHSPFGLARTSVLPEEREQEATLKFLREL